MKAKWFRVGLIGAVMVAALALLLRWSYQSKQASAGRASSSQGSSVTKELSPADQNQKAISFDQFVARLGEVKEPGDSRKILEDLRTELSKLPPEVASGLIREFLSSSQDASTKLNLTIGPGGHLADASSLRVFLFDYLGQIDRPAAGKVAAQVLAQYTTPDEWAVNLRNYAWAHPDDSARSYLQTKAQELINNPEWRAHPTSGFLEAFDTFVYAHATSAAPELTAMVRDAKNTATAHAAYLTLDRLTIAEPAAMLKQLITQPDLMKDREQTRANFVARADVSQSDQRKLIEDYLLDSTRSPAELQTFAALYPNANYMISNNLLTPMPNPRAGDLTKKDQAALEVVTQWQNDPRFNQVQPVLTQMRQRLETFVSQAAGGTP